MNPLIQGLSDTALEGAIRDLTVSRQWPYRLRQLTEEQERRRSKRRHDHKISQIPS